MDPSFCRYGTNHIFKTLNYVKLHNFLLLRKSKLKKNISLYLYSFKIPCSAKRILFIKIKKTKML